MTVEWDGIRSPVGGRPVAPLSTTMGYSRGSADAIGRVLGAKKKEGGE